MRILQITLLAACALAALLASSAARGGDTDHARLLKQAPGLKSQVLELALSAIRCAAQSGQARGARRLAVIDYSLPSTETRLWVFDLRRKRLLYAEHVSHGRGSGDNFATEFSNIEGSHQTSLGLFATSETYVGANGYSLRLDGLEPGINDLARQRAIVMHGAPYVNPVQALRQGRLGRSLGCPAVRPQVARGLIDSLRRGQLLFAYYPDPDWLAGSTYLSCQMSAQTGGGGSSAASAAR